MTMSKPFALVAACALGLAFTVNPVGALAPDCVCGGLDRRLSDSFLYPDGHYDEEAQEHLAQRRKLDECNCDGTLSTQESCCGCLTDEPLGRRLEPKSTKTKSPKSPKSPKASKSPKRSKSCKSSKSSGLPGRRLSDAENREEELPWASPAADGAELLAADPGIWSLPGFLDEELVDKLKTLLDKYGNNLGHYQDCFPLFPEEKKCFHFTPFLAETDQDDSELYLEVRAKIQSIWPQFYLREYLSVQDQKGHAGPTDYHTDGQGTPKQATVIIYLTDSEEGTGGDTVFPLVGEDGLSVSPRKGMALTWLNFHADGRSKEKSLHGAQATTHESSGRSIITQKFFLLPEERESITY